MFENKIIAKQPEAAENLTRRTVLESLRRVGMDEKAGPEIIRRLTLLEEGSEFNKDSRMIEKGAGQVLGYLMDKDCIILPERKIFEVRKAAILHDIGKSGPADATPGEQAGVVRLFAAENINDPEMSVSEAVQTYLSRESGVILEKLRKCGVDINLTMREFWDMHAQWTHDILEKHFSNLSRHTRIIAASHHIDRGINPYKLQDEEVPIEALVVGNLEYYSERLTGRILMALDKYGANIRRSGSDHTTAIAWLRNYMSTTHFAHDQIMNEVIEAIDYLGSRGELFENH